MNRRRHDLRGRIDRRASTQIMNTSACDKGPMTMEGNLTVLEGRRPGRRGRRFFGALPDVGPYGSRRSRGAGRRHIEPRLRARSLHLREQSQSKEVRSKPWTPSVGTPRPRRPLHCNRIIRSLAGMSHWAVVVAASLTAAARSHRCYSLHPATI